MPKENEFSGHESLELITSMINKAKGDYQDTGVSALFWGVIISFCGLVTFFNYYLHWKGLQFIWVLTFFAVIPQIMITVKEQKNRKHKSYMEDLMNGIWISYAIAIFVLSYITGLAEFPHQPSIYMILYGIPTFANGFARSFKPMIYGAIACWVFAILGMYIQWPYDMLLIVASAQLAWFIPGLILRRRYLKAKQQHV
ncbi:hypothetical protein ACX0G9_19660 [Flavitalea flava]